jgi:hypothetical protein
VEGDLTTASGGLAPQHIPVIDSTGGGSMRRLLIAWIYLALTLILVAGLSAQDLSFETNQMKERQQVEMKALKLKHKYTKESMKNQPIPKATRTQMENEMKREEKALKQKHHDEMETLKDRQRVMKEANRG